MKYILNGGSILDSLSSLLIVFLLIDGGTDLLFSVLLLEDVLDFLTQVLKGKLELINFVLIVLVFVAHLFVQVVKA